MENKDRFLLAQVADGDDAAFSRLYKLYHNKLYAFLFKLTRSEADAEDGMQEIFTRIFRNRHTLRDITSFDAYLFTASRHYFFNLLKKNSRTKYTDEFEGIPLPSPVTPEDELKLKHLREFIDKTRRELPPQQKRAYALSRDHEYTIAQIAAEMELSESTVKEHISKAIRTLRERCSDFLKLLLAIIIASIFNS